MDGCRWRERRSSVITREFQVTHFEPSAQTVAYPACGLPIDHAIFLNLEPTTFLGLLIRQTQHLGKKNTGVSMCVGCRASTIREQNSCSGSKFVGNSDK